MDSFRIVVTNSDSKKIRFVSWLTNPDSFRIVGHESFMFSKDSFRGFVSWIRFVDWFSKDSTCFYKSYESLRILSAIARNESLKIKIHESGFVTPNLKDSYRGFISWIRFWKIRFVDSFRANQNLKLLDSFRFVYESRILKILY